jgi:hypothetical protein
VQQGVEALRGGKVVISGVNPRCNALCERMESGLRDHAFDVNIVGPEHQFSHAAEMLDVDSIADPGRLLSNPRLNRHVFQVDCRSKQWMDWGRAMLMKMASLNREQTVRLWLLWPEGERRPAAKIVHFIDWDGCITPSDARIYAADRFRNRQGPGPTQYWEILASELAGPDLDLIDRMAAESTTNLFAVIDWLASLPRPAARSFEFGDVQSTFVSSVELAHQAKDHHASRETLLNRIWSAQVKTLFVAIEVDRPRVLAPFRTQLEQSFLRNPPREEDEIKEVPRDVEWGVADWHLRNVATVPEVTRRLLAQARLLRNCLAHGEPLDGPSLQRFLSAANAALRGRW